MPLKVCFITDSLEPSDTLPPCMHIPQFDQWPKWVQDAVLIPNLVLLVALNVWWPKSDKGWRRFGFGFAYLIIFLLVMYFAFGMRKW
jgi:hypothetical protein